MTPARDSRAVSEAMGVGVLIGITVLVTLSVGAGVILTEGNEDGSELEFNFIYSAELSQLTIQYLDDDDLSAGDVYVDGPANNVTWAELVGVDDDEPLTAVDTVFVHDRSAYGTNVDDDDFFRIVHAPEGDGSAVLAQWNEDQDDGGFGPSPDDPTEPGGPDEPGGP